MIAPYYKDDSCTIYNCDCRDVLPELSKFDLLLTDPPYGIGEATGNNKTRVQLAAPKDYGDLKWDDVPVSQSLINSLVDKASFGIVWGGNYYAMPRSSCWFVWNKKNGASDFADCELAWTNLPGAVRKIDYMWNGMIRQIPEKRWHPTQKPLTVMRWCIEQAIKKSKIEIKTIIDPFMGSGTTLVAAKELGIHCVGIDFYKDYCDTAIERLRQESLF
jgi:DNA modification methylase